MLLVLLAAFALAFSWYGIKGLFSTEQGIQEVQVSSDELNCGDDFTFYYYLETGGTAATETLRAVRELYTQAAVDAYQIFYVEAVSEGSHNLRYLNDHPNEAVAVDPALYEALTLLEESGTRYHYLAPMYELYFSLFQCGSDQEAVDFDPYRSEALSRFYQETAAFVNDPGAVDVELLGNDTVRLAVSDSYLDFAEENGISRYIDLFWMKNAFIADYIAETLLENGYTHGALFSGDGYARCLDEETGTEYAVDFSHREGNVISNAGSLRFSGTVSMVFLRGYPVDNGSGSNYYVYEDGTIRTPYIDPADGLDRCSVPELAVCSKDLSCAEVALRTAPLYIAETLDREALTALTEEGVVAWYYENGELRSTGAL